MEIGGNEGKVLLNFKQVKPGLGMDAIAYVKRLGAYTHDIG